MSVLMMVALVFVACDKDDDVVEVLRFSKDAVELVVEGENAEVDVKNGTAPFTFTVNNEGIVEVSIEESKVTIKPLAEGEATITVKDNDGVEGAIKVAVAAKYEPEGGEE